MELTSSARGATGCDREGFDGLPAFPSDAALSEQVDDPVWVACLGAWQRGSVLEQAPDGLVGVVVVGLDDLGGGRA